MAVELDESHAIFLGPREGEELSGPRRELRVKYEGDEFELLEFWCEPGFGPIEPHVHEDHVDSFYVLEGEVEFHVGDEILHATAGSYVLAPQNVVHWFRNMSDAPVRMLNLHTPGGFVQYRRELRELRDQGIEPDREFFERHDVFDV
jgi:mannose-6-phosphate isomerase-like protein (cupin superfamily)